MSTIFLFKYLHIIGFILIIIAIILLLISVYYMWCICAIKINLNKRARLIYARFLYENVYKCPTHLLKTNLNNYLKEATEPDYKIVSYEKMCTKPRDYYVLKPFIKRKNYKEIIKILAKYERNSKNEKSK